MPDKIIRHSHIMTVANLNPGDGYLIRAVPKTDQNSVPTYVFWETDKNGTDNETAPASISYYPCIRY
jgi:hypothetical protein